MINPIELRTTVERLGDRLEDAIAAAVDEFIVGILSGIEEVDRDIEKGQDDAEYSALTDLLDWIEDRPSTLTIEDVKAELSHRIRSVVPG